MLENGDLPLISENEDILSFSCTYTPSIGRVAVLVTLSEGYGEISRSLVYTIKDEDLSSAFNDCLRVLLNEISPVQLI